MFKKFSLLSVLSLIALLAFFNSCSDDNQFEAPIVGDVEMVENLTDNDYSQMLGCLLSPKAEYEAISIADEVQLKAIPTYKYLNCPNVGNQGRDGACVGWGTAYAARTIMAGVSRVFSPSYVYNQTKISTCASGTYPTRALNLLVDQGVCTIQSMPYKENDCYVQPTYSQRSEASRFRITSYSRLNINVSSIRNQIAAGRAVIVAGLVDSYFQYLGSNRILSTVSGTGGGHCYAVVGYSDQYRCFRVLNSWGTGWASEGYGWISYDIVPSLWSEAYVIY